MKTNASEKTTGFIRSLPKTETHLHIEGALPFSLLQNLRPDLYPAAPASWASDFRFSSFGDFEEALISMAQHWYTSPERYHDAAEVVFRQLRETQNVRYVETSYASGVIEWAGLDGRAVSEAIRAAVPSGLEVRIFLGIHHSGYHEGTSKWIDDSLDWPALDGYDLHGDEAVPLGSWAAEFWSHARATGKFTKAHAGEFAGPDFVRRVHTELGVRRIEHGIRAMEDPSLVAELAAAGAVFDVCPISNVKLQVTPSASDHPIKRLMAAGVQCTLSTDDPLVFGNTLFDEYRLLADSLGFSNAELASVARAGFEVALVDDAWRADRIKEISTLSA